MAYPSTAELVAASTSSELQSLTAEQQEALRVAAIAAIEEYTNQSFQPVTETKLVDGTGTHAVPLPTRLESIISLTIAGEVVAPDKVKIDGNRLVLPTFVPNYAEQALYDIQDLNWRDIRFPTGMGVISIEGVWGWTDTPAPVVNAIRWDMEEQAAADTNVLAGSIASYRALGIRTISQGNLNVVLDSTTALSDRVRRALEPYRWSSDFGFVV